MPSKSCLHWLQRPFLGSLLCPNTTRNDSRRAADRRTNQLLGSVLDGASSCVQREPPPRPPEERAEPAVASCSRPPKDALGKKHRRCLQPAGGLPPAGQRDGGGGHAADRRRPVRDGARAARRLLRGDLRDLRRPRLRPARQRERRLLQVQHRRGAASPPRAGAGAGRAIRAGPESTALRTTGRRRVRAPRGAGGDRRRRPRRRDFRAAERVVVAVAVKQLLRCRVDTARRRALDRGGTRGAAMRDGGRRVLRGARRVPLDRAGAAPGARRALLRRRRRRRGVAEVCAVGRGGRGPASSSFLYSGWR